MSEIREQIRTYARFEQHILYNLYPSPGRDCIKYAIRAVEMVNAGKGGEVVEIQLDSNKFETLRDETGKLATADKLVSDWRLEEFINQD